MADTSRATVGYPQPIDLHHVVRESRGFYVTWEIETVKSTTPLEAAREARDAQTRPGTLAVVFTVTDPHTGGCWQVDLADDEPVWQLAY